MPPCATGESSPSGMSATKSAACAIAQCLPQLLVGGVRIAIAQIARDRPGEQVRPSAARGRCAAQQARVEVAYVDSVDQTAARR